MNALEKGSKKSKENKLILKACTVPIHWLRNQPSAESSVGAVSPQNDWTLFLLLIEYTACCLRARILLQASANV